MNAYKVGLDIGSTTAKMVVLDKDGTTVLFSGYKRHQAKIQECLLGFLYQIKEQLGDIPLSFHITGSVGMGISEKCSLPFVQEVVAATNYVRREHPHTATMIDIGGEDAKVVFFQDGQATDLRMNGNCAGGTGAFIDQMAILLGVSIDELNELALRSNQVYSIASRCGVCLLYTSDAADDLLCVDLGDRRNIKKKKNKKNKRQQIVCKDISSSVVLRQTYSIIIKSCEQFRTEKTH